MHSVTSNGSRNRQRDFRSRMEAAGFVQVSGWVHRDQQADTIQLLRRLKEDGGLRPGPVRITTTGKLAKLEG